MPVPVELVVRRIFVIRSQRVMLSPHLAELYQVEARALIQAVKRNRGRFPEDFMFQLTDEEYANLKSQIVISSWGGLRRATPYAFTEHGVAMLSSVLNSERAVQMNILIIRAFVKLREVLATNRVLAQRIEQLAATTKDHAALFDIVIKDVQALDKKFTKEILRLKNPPRRKARIGFHVPCEK
ncbi:MAG: ORF6N domain-containing protein [Bryobacteraceae bacterium]